MGSKMRIARSILTHTTIFFFGYRLAGGCEYRHREIEGSYITNPSPVEKRVENHESRLRDLEEKIISEDIYRRGN